MLKSKRIIALIMSALLIATVAGCKKAPAEDSEYSVIYVTRGEEEGTTEDTSAEDDSAEDESTKDSSSKNNSSKNNSSKKNTSKNSSSKKNTSKNNSSKGNTSNKVTSTYKPITGRKKDLKGREIVFIQTWDATDRSSAAGKLFGETENFFNCKLVERKTSNYTTLYASILAGQPIADLFCPKDKSVLNMAKNNMLTPLDTLDEFDFSEDCWDQSALKDYTLNGHVYGMSRGLQWRELLFYNKDMFEKNNWPDLFELQQAGKLDWNTLYSIMEKAVKVTDYGLVPVYHYNYLAASMLKANGVNGVERVGDTTEFKNNFTTSTACMNAMNTFKKWLELPNGVYDANKGGWDSGRSVFYSGQAAMAMIDYNMFATIENNADFEWGVVLFPHGPDSSVDLYMHNTTATCIPAGVENPNDIALFWDVCRDNFNESFGAEHEIGTDYDKSYYVTLNKYIRGCQKGYGLYDFSKEFGIADKLVEIAKGQTTPAAAVESVKNTVASTAKSYWG